MAPYPRPPGPARRDPGQILQRRGQSPGRPSRRAVPRHILEKAPTAGLWPGQTDEEELGISYQDADAIHRGLEQGRSREDLKRSYEGSKVDLPGSRKNREEQAQGGDAAPTGARLCVDPRCRGAGRHPAGCQLAALLTTRVEPPVKRLPPRRRSLALELAYGHRRAYVDRPDNGPVDRTNTDASLVDEGPALKRLSSVYDLLRRERHDIDQVPGDGTVHVRGRRDILIVPNFLLLVRLACSRRNPRS